MLRISHVQEWTDEYAAVDHRQTWMTVKQIGRPTQVARTPPTIVVAKGDVRLADAPDAARSSCGTSVRAERQYFHLWICMGHLLDSVIS